MGPITLFDKSFLQGLSVDESLWFDQFFLANVCPLFFLETLADLGKPASETRPPEEVVRSLAEKFPEMHGSPCVIHMELALANLHGQPIEMRGRIPMGGGRPVQKDGKTGVVYEQSLESRAFERWLHGDFLYVERKIARHWRATLQNINLGEVSRLLQAAGISGKTVKSLEEAKAYATAIVDSTQHGFERLLLALVFLNVPQSNFRPIQERWVAQGQPPLRSYAPYAAFVLEIELFFRIALAASLISADRVSNRTDIAYLFYLPFCMVFTSSDNLHRRCAHLFMGPNQSFAWGQDLKADLSALNTYFLSLPDDVKAKGVMSFAHGPPVDSQGVIAQLWDKHIGAWRTQKREELPSNPRFHEKLSEHIRSLEQSGAPTSADKTFGDTDSLIIKRVVRKKKGNWFQVPKDLKPES